MTDTDWLMLAGVFLGGAVPWLEAVVVIPAGVVAGLPPLLVVIAGVTGNLLTVALAAWAGERLRASWLARRAPAGAAAMDTGEHERRPSRAQRVMARWGLPALAVLGPVGIGTQVSTVVAVGAGVRAGVAFAWIACGTVAWSVVAALLAIAGASVAGIGA